LRHLYCHTADIFKLADGVVIVVTDGHWLSFTRCPSAGTLNRQIRPNTACLFPPGLSMNCQGKVLQLVWRKCSYSVYRLQHALNNPEVIKVKGQGHACVCMLVDMNAYRFLVLSEQSELWLVATIANWVVRCEVTCSLLRLSPITHALS